MYPDAEGETLLIIAIEKFNALELIEILLKGGTDSNLIGKWGIHH